LNRRSSDELGRRGCESALAYPGRSDRLVCFPTTDRDRGETQDIGGVQRRLPLHKAAAPWPRRRGVDVRHRPHDRLQADAPTPRRLTSRTADPREREVLALMAEGRSNSASPASSTAANAQSKPRATRSSRGSISNLSVPPIDEYSLYSHSCVNESGPAACGSMCRKRAARARLSSIHRRPSRRRDRPRRNAGP
jgi:hypothetical protein